MNHILLLGAGFSRNWGGYLADEFFETLIGASEIRKDHDLRGLLWKFRKSGFENALAELQERHNKNPKFKEQLRHLQSAISETFQSMNEAFFRLSNIDLGQNHRSEQLKTFMFKFDAIFTLNQDILLEHHYCRSVDHLRGKWSLGGVQIPGMKLIPNIRLEPHIKPSWGRDLWVPLDRPEFRVEDRQPFFKLHGSSNWQDKEKGGQLLVTGGKKARAIASHAVLEWYFEQFRNYLRSTETRLLVIGYGFRDSHVNDAIIESVEKHGLQFFIVDTRGSGVVDQANSSSGGVISDNNKQLNEAFMKGLVGASRRSLREIFGLDHDEVAFSQVTGFVNPNH